jgi:hypothetical protein
MFARRVRVEYERAGERRACPIKWLDSFAMRSFTNSPVFDDTLPLADGLLAIGSRVPIDSLREAMRDWFQKKSYIPKDAELVVMEAQAAGAPLPSE